MNEIQRSPIRTVKCDKEAVGATRGKFLYLRKEGSSKQGGDFFKITKTVGEGEACVCYEATLVGEKKNGRLEEFYPSECLSENAPFVLVRDGNNHIVSTEETKEAFIAARNDFARAYHVLRDVMAENRKNADFTSFIQDFSIYYACDEQGNYIENSTVYIWSAPQNLTVFEKYIQDIHRFPGAHPEHKLFTVLKTASSLAKCIKILHEKDLLHLDIHPGNFGIPQRKKELLTDSVTLLDVNTIYSLKNSFTGNERAEAFSAPEVALGKAEKASDIYSIGCTLFSALIVNDEIKEGGYSKEYYSKLSELIDTSKLISASETNSNIFLKCSLTGILRKCLAELPGKRYKRCSELVEDLDNALAYLYPHEISSKLPANKQIVILDKELDKKRGPGTHLSLIYHLYKHPLFEKVDADDESIDVLIVGFGNYGQRFLDCCLQFGQIYGKKLNVKAISNNRISGTADKDIYLEKRPELSGFFSIDETEVENAYGRISFITKDFVSGAGATKKNQELAVQIIDENEKTRYIFIALGDDKLNKNVAEAFVNATKDRSGCSVNYVVDSTQATGKAFGNPVCMLRDITTEHDFQDIELMAFNAHLIWYDSLSIDMARAWQKFKEDYNYVSSISNAISIKYKLYGAGLSLDDRDETAERFADILSRDPKQRNALIALEHQRWNCEKLCAGYTPLTDLDSCVEGDTRDKKAKKHICLVRSCSEAPLCDDSWSYERWDSATDAELKTLDPLDQLSVRLHQKYLKRANEIRQSVSLFDDTMKRLKLIANKKDASEIAFSEWFSALSLIWSGLRCTVREYKPLKDTLIKAFRDFDTDDKNTAVALVEIIDKRFSVLLKSMEYTDWKSTDARLVDYIPFILTNKKNIHLAIPFSAGNNTQIFCNVAVPTVVNPSQVTYFYHFTDISDIAPFQEAIQYIFNYLPQKSLYVKLNFVLSYKKNAGLATKMEELKTGLDENSYTQKIILLESADEYDIAKNVTSVLDEKLHVDAIEQNCTPLSYLLMGAGVYRNHPKYCFSISKKSFYDVVGCNYLKYIKSAQYLRVSDIFACMNSKGVVESPLTFYKDYEKLWKKAYRGQESIWKKTCKLLSEHHDNDTVVTVSFDSIKEKGKIEKYRYLVPAAAFVGAKAVIDFFVEAKVFEKDSSISFYTPDSCEINISASEALRDKIRILFSDASLLIGHENLLLKKTPHSVGVAYDYLKVKGLDLKAAGKNADRVKKLLQLLESEFSFITGLTESSSDSQVLSFNYATKRIKKLLTNEGNILEVYIYLRCLKSGLFDDVTTSYEITWEGTPITSEFDIVITKGFASLLIEAKATEEIKQDYYFKLAGLANEFGTNAKAVLVADTVERYYFGNVENNAMQRQRGNMLDVYTVSDPKDIDNIEIVLAKILNIPIPKKSTPAAAENKPASPAVETVDEQNANLQVKPKVSSDISPDSKIWVLNSNEFLEQSQVQILSNHGIATVGQFLEQTIEQLRNIKNAKGRSFEDRYMEIQRKIKKKMGIN